MTHHDNTPARGGAGPFGYTLDDLISRPPEEREDMLGADAFASSFDQRDDLTAEAADFREVLGEAGKLWKTNAGRNSPFLPALASLPKHEQSRVRNQSQKFRELIAFGETPDRWEWDVKNLRDSGDLLDPEADTERLMGLYETKDDLIPGLDATDHALDYLDELEKLGGAESPDAPLVRNALAAIGLPAGRSAGDPATIPPTREAVLRYGPGQDAPPQAAPALHAPEQVYGALNTGFQLEPPANTPDAQLVDYELQTHAQQANEEVQPSPPAVSKPGPTPPDSSLNPDESSDEQPDDGDGDDPVEDQINEKCIALQLQIIDHTRQEVEQFNKLTRMDEEINALKEQRRILSNEVMEHLGMGAASSASDGIPDTGVSTGPGRKKTAKKLLKKFTGVIGAIPDAVQAYEKQGKIEKLEKEIFSTENKKEGEKYALAATTKLLSEIKAEYDSLGCKWSYAWGYPG